MHEFPMHDIDLPNCNFSSIIHHGVSFIDSLSNLKGETIKK